eukprot:GEMP01026933.1.p1 GENE.GEMP01026933.1~~GEMP01026933.1.p1  ORF type:complete len:357 (+),score=63.69 GEMP01026933.1:70-1140(+)
MQVFSRRRVKRKLTNIPEKGTAIVFWYRFIIIAENARSIVESICHSPQAGIYWVNEKGKVTHEADDRNEPAGTLLTEEHNTAPAVIEERPALCARRSDVYKIYCPIQAGNIVNEISKASCRSTLSLVQESPNMTKTTTVTVSQRSTAQHGVIELSPSAPHGAEEAFSSVRLAPAESSSSLRVGFREELLARVELIPIQSFTDEMPAFTASTIQDMVVCHLFDSDCDAIEDLERKMGEIRTTARFSRTRAPRQVVITNHNTAPELFQDMKMHVLKYSSFDGEDLFDFVAATAQELFDSPGLSGSMSRMLGAGLDWATNKWVSSATWSYSTWSLPSKSKKRTSKGEADKSACTCCRTM